MTVLDPVINFLLSLEVQTVALTEVIAATERPRRPVLRVLDKLTREGYLEQINDDPVPARTGEFGKSRRNPTWNIIRDLSDRPKQALHKKHTLRDTIWRLIRAKRHFTRPELVMSSGASQGSVDDYILQLEQHGYIRKTGKDGRFTTYMLISRQVERPTGINRRKGGQHE